MDDVDVLIRAALDGVGPDARHAPVAVKFHGIHASGVVIKCGSPSRTPAKTGEAPSGPLVFATIASTDSPSMATRPADPDLRPVLRSVFAWRLQRLGVEGRWRGEGPPQRMEDR